MDWKWVKVAAHGRNGLNIKGSEWEWAENEWEWIKNEWKWVGVGGRGWEWMGVSGSSWE